MSAFWQLLYYAMHLSVQCTDVTQSTHSVPSKEFAVTYGGNCLQALLYALSDPTGALAWIVGSV